MANELQRRNSLFDNLMGVRDFMNDEFFSDVTPAADYMKTDITEDDKNYKLRIDMPGFAKKDIHINYANNLLTITGRRDTFADDSDKNGNVLHTERRYGQMSRQYRLPDVDRAKVTAQYNDGVLSITLPRLQASTDDDSRIDIE